MYTELQKYTDDFASSVLS